MNKNDNLDKPISQQARPPLSTLIIYALGQFGWSLASYGVANLLVYYYMPPEDGAHQMFPTLIYQGAVFGILTIVGLLGAFGRIFDAFIDPWVGNMSDRSTSRFGKRRFFMGISAVPFALLGFLVFFPLFPGNVYANTIFLVVVLLLYYFFFTLYTIPYTSLIGELGHNKSDRMKISTMLSFAWAFGFIFGNSIYKIQEVLEGEGMLPADAFLFGQLGLSLLALVLLLFPVFFLNEKKYALQRDTSFNLKSSIQEVFKNKNYRWFLVSDLFYWSALTFILLGIGFYTTILFSLEKSFALTFSLIGFVISFLLYIPVNLLTKKYGKKSLFLAGYAAFSITFFLLGFSDKIPLPSEQILYGLAFLSALPLAVFGILPNALIGDEVEYAAAQSGEKLSGMYYGVRAFVMKAGISLANLVFPSLLLLGKSIENPAGVRLSAFFAMGLCIIGGCLFSRYTSPSVTIE